MATATSFDDHLANQLLAQRIIFLGTEVNDESAQRACSQLLLLAAEDPHAPAVEFARSAFQHACVACSWDPTLAATATGTPPPVH